MVKESIVWNYLIYELLKCLAENRYVEMSFGGQRLSFLLTVTRSHAVNAWKYLKIM